MKNTTRNTKTSTFRTVTLLNKIEGVRRIVTVITVVPKEGWVPFGFNCWQSSLPSSEEIFIPGNSLCSALWKSKSLLSHWLPATQILRLSNLIHILLFELLSILHVQSWHSDLSLRLWGPWSLNVLTISFVFLWVRRPAHYENTQYYFSVSLTRTAVCICKFNPRQHTSTIRSSKHRRQILFNCFLLLFWKISDQMISLDYYHPWSSFHISTCQFWAMKRCRLVSVVKLTTFLAPYEHVLITCCLSFQVFRGSVFYF